MRNALLLFALVACNNSSTSKAPDAPASSTSSAEAPPSNVTTLSDEVVKQAVTQKMDVLVVKVTDLTTGGAGSRSELTTYTMDIVKSLSGGASGSIKLSAYGAPSLEKGKTYALTTRGGNPMWGTKGIKESAEVPAGQEDATAALLAKKVSSAGP